VLGGARNNRVLSKERFDIGRGSCWNTKLVSEGASQLDQNDFGHDEIVVGDHEVKNVRAESTRSECAHQYIRVRKNPHETSRKTSSSVKYPLDSAKGITFRRNCSNCINASWRFRA
jgi:hypothetical protein